MLDHHAKQFLSRNIVVIYSCNLIHHHRHQALSQSTRISYMNHTVSIQSDPVHLLSQSYEVNQYTCAFPRFLLYAVYLILWH